LSRHDRRVVLLGPQQPTPYLAEEMRRLAVAGPVATITAGWQERESEDDELDENLQGRSVNLQLYARAENVWAEDPDLGRAHREAQAMLRELRRVYNVRLVHAMEAWRAVHEMDAPAAVIDPERKHALKVMGELDAHHRQRIVAVRARFFQTMDVAQRPAVARHRRELSRRLREVSVVAIAGGHIAILLNRLRLFGLDRHLAGKTLVAWSAGAMALSKTVVLFHDHPPQGPGHAEVFDEGLDCIPDVVLLPDGSRRLDLADTARVARFAQRFAPRPCLLLDHGTRLTWSGRAWSSRAGARRLGLDGGLKEVRRW
jgi:hypothetical protein